MSFAVIFDMDGVIIDSEPLWRKAEIEIFKQIGLHLTDQLCRETKGLRMDLMINYWYQKAHNPNITKAKLATELIAKVTELIHQIATPMPGLIHLMQQLKANNITMGLCSSSALKLIETVIQQFDLKQYLAIYHSGENEIYAKPHPKCYQTTAQLLGYQPQNCIVFEDSTTGAIAAKAASMKVIAVPEPIEKDNRFDFCDMVINSLEDISINELHTLAKNTI
ncbi:hexitol phosphatase HxpB [Thiotrichales bacterium 19S3-7]|nr:hexitol phosphatase HxpB [Thiotrichales bacterium 19S3-7]MCF6802690.1 hexitol phosphatase HxpB [Thiotrichales bacterium 19S3-11]